LSSWCPDSRMPSSKGAVYMTIFYMYRESSKKAQE
jgi:hypothetical protein